MTSPVNYVDPTGHYFAKIDIAGHYKTGSNDDSGGESSVVVVPEPESRPDTTTGSSTGSGGSGAGSGSGSSGSGFGCGGSSSWVSEPESFLETCGNYWNEQAMAEQRMAEYATFKAMPAAIKSFRVDLGTGFGVLESVGVPKILELAGGWKTDVVHIRYDDGKWTAGSEVKKTWSAGIPNSASYGKYKSTYLTFDGQTIVEEEMYGILGINSALYIFGGFEIVIGIDINEFFEEINKN